MKILYFSVENFRNIKNAVCEDVPNFMVVCGGNGSGKSALLEALMTAKERAGAYGNFNFDPRVVSVDSDKSRIIMGVLFSDGERDFLKTQYDEECPEKDEIVIEIDKDGRGRPIKRSQPVARLFGYYSRSFGSLGFFDYITAYRQAAKVQLNNWDASFLSDERIKNTLAIGQQKFQMTKQYLASLKMQDLQAIQASQQEGHLVIPDSLQEIRETFDRFFAPLKFKDVYLDRSPFGFVIETPLGEIDIDDLSSGEKEILNIFVRFHQLKPADSVILFDEADAHLHPDLERRYLFGLKELSKGNQLILTTHSPEMMIAAGSDALYTIHKESAAPGENQLVRVTEDEILHDTLSELMGSRGLVSINQRIVFIEGESASADRMIYESFYPPSQYNISFVPSGNSSTTRNIAERINLLLTSSIGFQQFFSIVDQDIQRFEEDPTDGSRLFYLPVYHVENFLLNIEEIFAVTKSLLGMECRYQNPLEVKDHLESLLLKDGHLRPYARALLDAELAVLAKKAYDSVYKSTGDGDEIQANPTFDDMVQIASEIIESTIIDGTWKVKCKGRDLLKSYCGELGLRYEHFRNSLISRLEKPPKELDNIVQKILSS